MTQCTCITCFYNDTNSCRRYPPSVSIVLVPRMSLVTQKTELQPTDMACFPAVQGEHWCGEWKEREEKPVDLSGMSSWQTATE